MDNWCNSITTCSKNFRTCIIPYKRIFDRKLTQSVNNWDAWEHFLTAMNKTFHAK